MTMGFLVKGRRRDSSRAAGHLQNAIDATKPDAFARRLLAGVTVALTALVLLTGCGGSSSSSSTASTKSLSSSGTQGDTSTTWATLAASTEAARHCDPEPCQLTRAELAAELDALCRRGNPAVKQADASFEQATKATDYTKAAAAMESALREFPPYQLAIQGLTPPPRDKALFTRYEDLTTRIHDLSERMIAAGRAGNTPEVIRVSQLVQEQLVTRAKAAVDLGTTHCGR